MQILHIEKTNKGPVLFCIYHMEYKIICINITLFAHENSPLHWFVYLTLFFCCFTNVTAFCKNRSVDYTTVALRQYCGLIALLM
ncbi:ABC transporter G family member 19 [Labeo rohita]|uniref:ABC transporter G family member 19 n=1 Tax=Labeo rohita TaxID=84645 RepID=A0ABQ8M1Z1_LABRO|nr:ABC transporter G family member 19 [Labeo rohita]